MGHQPARAFRDEATQEENAQAETGTDAEGQPPAEIGVEPAGRQQLPAAGRAQRSAEPEAAADDEVGLRAKARRDQFLDRRIDRGVFAADAGSCEAAEHRKTAEIPGERGRRGGEQIERQGHVEEFPAAEPIGQPAEQDRARHCAGQVATGRGADFGVAQPEPRARLERARERARQGHLEPVEDPGDPERQDHEDMKARPGQPVEPPRNVGFDRRGRGRRGFNSGHEGAASEPGPAVARSCGFRSQAHHRGHHRQRKPSRPGCEA